MKQNSKKTEYVTPLAFVSYFEPDKDILEASTNAGFEDINEGGTFEW